MNHFDEITITAFEDELEKIAQHMEKTAGVGDFFVRGIKGLGRLGNKSMAARGRGIKNIAQKGYRAGGGGAGGVWEAAKRLGGSTYGAMAGTAGATGLAGYGAYKATIGRDRRPQPQYQQQQYQGY